MRKYLAILLFLVPMASFAQQSYVYFSWDINTPMSNKDWIGTGSTSGAKLGFRHFIGPDSRFAAGVDLNWSYYQEYKPTETFQQSGGATTTDYFNEIFAIGLTANGQYYFPVGNGERLFPYAGLGLGASRNDYSVLYNIYTDQESKWGFLARPEVGILVRVGNRRRMGVMAAVHYDYSTAGSTTYGYKNFSALGFQLGIVLFQW